MSEISKPELNKQTNNGKPVSQCYPGTKTVIKHFSSSKEASNALNIDWSHIAAVARANRSGNAGKKGYRSSAGKYNWYFSDDLNTIEASKDENTPSKPLHENESTPPKPKTTLALTRKQPSTEIWRPVTNYPNYLVSNLGNIKKTNGAICDYTKTRMTDKGYLISLSQNNVGTQTPVGNLVAKEFVENPSGYFFVKYIDGDKTNTKATNLIWVGRSNVQLDPTVTNVLKTFDTPSIIEEAQPEVDVPDMITYSDDDFVTENDKKQLTKEKQIETNNYVQQIKNIKSEIWRPVDGYKYHISNLGRVRNDSNQSILEGHLGRYYVAELVNNGERKSKSVHILVAQAFLPNPYKYPIVNHLDANKHNARVDNLEWSTHSNNSVHAYQAGLVKKTKTKQLSTAMYQLDLNDNIIEQFSSLQEAVRETKTSARKIVASLSGHGTTKGLYKWAYCENHDGEHEMYDDEEWRKVTDYPDYSVSNYGRIRNDLQREAGRPCLKILYKQRGYMTCGLSKDKKSTTLLVSRLVAIAFIPNPTNLPMVDHINTITTDNRVGNLRWVNAVGNMNNDLTKQKNEKAVAQCHLGTKTVIKHFRSSKEAYNELKIDPSHITGVARANHINNFNKRGHKQAGGYSWWYKDDLEGEQSELQTPTPPKPKITLNLTRK